MKQKRITVSAEHLKRLKIQAALTDRSVSKLLDQIIEAGLTENESELKKAGAR